VPPITTLSSILLKRLWSWVTSAGTGEPFYTPHLCYGARSTSLSKFLRLLARGWRESWRHGSISICSLAGRSFEDHHIISHPLPVSRRLYSLELSSGELSFIRPLLQLGPDDFPLLKHLRLRGTKNQADTTIMRAPALEDVSLNLVSSADPLSYPLRWPLLMGLDLECYPSWNPQEGGLDTLGALNVLRRCPNIVRCKLRITRRVPFGTSVDMSPIVLPQIHSLVFTGLCHSQDWISHWVVPKLRYLQVGDSKFADAASHAGDKMTAHINSNGFTSSSLQQLYLRLLPEMVYGYSDTPLSLYDTFLALFCPPHALCPMLTDFMMTAPSTGFSDTAALGFVRGRMTMAAPLQNFPGSIRPPAGGRHRTRSSTVYFGRASR
jgi:hypothetical protein